MWKNNQEIKHFTGGIPLSGWSPESNHVLITLCLLPLGEATSHFKTSCSGKASAYEDWSVTEDLPLPTKLPRSSLSQVLIISSKMSQQMVQDEPEFSKSVRAR